MKMGDKKKSNTTQVAISIPNSLKEKIVESATKNCRSIGSEIVYRLLSSFPNGKMTDVLLDFFEKFEERKKRRNQQGKNGLTLRDSQTKE